MFGVIDVNYANTKRVPTCSFAQSLLNQITFLAPSTLRRHKSHEIEYFCEMNIPRTPPFWTNARQRAQATPKYWTEMRFPMHNAQWLHKSNKLINFWNTLRSLSSAAASICLVVVVTQTVCTQSRTEQEQIHGFSIHSPRQTHHPPIQLPSSVHNPVSILIPIHRSNPFAAHPLQQLQQRTLIIEFLEANSQEIWSVLPPARSSRPSRVERGVNKTQTKLTYCRSNTFSKSLPAYAQWTVHSGAAQQIKYLCKTFAVAHRGKNENGWVFLNYSEMQATVML